MGFGQVAPKGLMARVLPAQNHVHRDLDVISKFVVGTFLLESLIAWPPGRAKRGRADGRLQLGS
jgi:hypothetical protein